jgi:hypothetical protein
MNQHLTSTVAGTRKSVRKPHFVAACGAALALTLAAGIGTWQTVAHREGTGTTVVEPAAAPIAPAARTAATTTGDPTSTFYLVGSQDQAAQVQAAIDDGNRILNQFGKPPFNAQVVVVASAEEEAILLQGLSDADAIRASLGLPPLPLIDLRAR